MIAKGVHRAETPVDELAARRAANANRRIAESKACHPSAGRSVPLRLIEGDR